MKNRLREITQETDAEQRKKITDLEKELSAVDDMQCMYLLLLITIYVMLAKTGMNSAIHTDPCSFGARRSSS